MNNTKEAETPATDVDPRYPNTPIGIVRSRDAFLRDLPALLANPKYDRWLAVYRDAERIALGETHAEIIRQCKGKDLKEDECYIGCVFPHSNEEDEEIEFGLAEFEDDDPQNPGKSAPTS